MICQGCAHRSTAGEALDPHELVQMSLDESTPVRRHNSSGCDLCNRTGVSGRTLLLDAMLITPGPAERDKIYKALMSNVNEILDEKGVIVHSRKEGLIDLVTGGFVDPKSAVSYLES